MKRHGHLLERIVDLDNIRGAIRNAVRNHRKSNESKYVIEHIDEIAVKVRNLILSGEFRTSEYREQTIYEPKERQIYILPLYPDRIVQHAIVDVLAPLWDKTFIYESWACREGKGAHNALKEVATYVKRYKYGFKYDIRGFYRHIDHCILKRIVAKKIKDKAVLAPLYEIIDSFPGGYNCPIGNLTSQWFGNLYMNELDHYLKEEVGVKAYVRYCDDFHVFADTKEELWWYDKCIAAFVHDELKLEFSKRRLYRTKDGCDFLGYRTFPEKILVRKSTARRMMRKVRGIRRIFNANPNLGLRRLQSMMGGLASIRGVLKHAQTHNLKEKIGFEEIYERVIKRYQEVLRTRNRRSDGRRQGEDAGCPEQGDCHQESGVQNQQASPGHADSEGIRDGSVLLQFGSDESPEDAVHGVCEHRKPAQGGEAEESSAVRDGTEAVEQELYPDLTLGKEESR